MPYQFIGETQTAAADDGSVVENDCVVQTAALGESGGEQLRQIAVRGESPARGKFAFKGFRRNIQ